MISIHTYNVTALTPTIIVYNIKETGKDIIQTEYQNIRISEEILQGISEYQREYQRGYQNTRGNIKGLIISEGMNQP